MSRKKKNRRRERRHVLDVKLSSNQVRRRRAQLALSAVFAIVFLVVTVYGLWRGGWWAVQRFVYHNEQLQIREFQVRTDGVIDRDHLARWSGVKLGDNLFAVDLHAIKRHLEMHGMIRQASLERVLPGTLRLQVSEREPLARVKLYFSMGDGRLLSRVYGLDRSGRVMPLDQSIVRPETVQIWQRLPEITGLNPAEIVPGRDLTNRVALAAMDFVAAFNASTMKQLVQIGYVDVSDAEVLHVQTLQGQKVDLLDQGFARQLARWRAIHEYCYSKRASYSWIDLSPTNYIPIKAVPLALAASADPPSNL